MDWSSDQFAFGENLDSFCSNGGNMKVVIHWDLTNNNWKFNDVDYPGNTPYHGLCELTNPPITSCEVCDGVDNDCDGVPDNGVDMECVFGDAGCDNTTCKLIVGEELTCETSLGSDVNKITLLEVEAKDNELVATISCSNNLMQVGFSLMDFGANSLGDVNVFDESGVKQDGLVDCNICPIKYVLQNDLLEFNEIYLVNTGGGVTYGDCEESAYVYYGKTSGVAIPDNNIVLVILIISIVAFISTKKRI